MPLFKLRTQDKGLNFTTLENFIYIRNGKGAVTSALTSNKFHEKIM